MILGKSKKHPMSFVWIMLFMNISTLVEVSSLASERREVLQKAAEFGSGLFISNLDVEQDVSNANEEMLARPYRVYKIKADASKLLKPKLFEVKRDSFLASLTNKISKNGGAIWLGEHHNSQIDHLVQVDIIKYFAENKKQEVPLSIGLEQVQVQYQPVLDRYISGEITESQLVEQIEWEKRWTWAFKVYQPIFRLARERRIPMIALNVNSEDLALVEKDGLPGLPSRILDQYITDRPGFASFASAESFKEYVNYVITPSYELHKQMGLLRSTISGQQLPKEMTFRNFFSGRMLWDEGMASKAYSWCKSNPGGVMIGLVGADHVKFGRGIPSRFERMAKSDTMISSHVILNPTQIDSNPPTSINDMMDANSRSSKIDNLTLQLRYLPEKGNSNTLDAGVLPFSEYIIVT